MEKSKSLMSRAYETPEIEEIMVEIPILTDKSPEDVGGGGMDNPSPEDPD